MPWRQSSTLARELGRVFDLSLILPGVHRVLRFEQSGGHCRRARHCFRCSARRHHAAPRAMTRSLVNKPTVPSKGAAGVLKKPIRVVPDDQLLLHASCAGAG
jgi:hypothetical protein